jgi:uncharacterized protein YifN (PemK superfamily)
MVKVRPVIVVSPNHNHYSQLYTIVPISSTPPKIVRAYHYKFAAHPVPGSETDAWAKCDLVTTVALHRLDRVMVKRNYLILKIRDEELLAIRACLKHVLGIA